MIQFSLHSHNFLRKFNKEFLGLTYTQKRGFNSDSNCIYVSELSKKAEIFISAKQGKQVFFDYLSVQRRRMLARIVQENHYYPFGLNIQGLEYLDALDTNTFALYNGKEDVLKNYLEYNDYGARYYDPQIGRWNVVDPLADKLPSWCPYSFCLNNPLLYIDPDGAFPYPITIRSFHPSTGFGGSSLGPGLGRDFSGDNRSFSNRLNSTARVSHTLTADPDKGTLSYSDKNTFSSPSHHPYFGEGNEIPSGYVSKTDAGNGSIAFETGYCGTNPVAIGPTPDIDVKSFFIVTQTNDILNINANLYGDDFPNTEVFVKDPSGQSLFLGIDVRAEGQDNNPLILIGGATENIMNINVSVKIDSNGNFTGVIQGDKTWTIADWNERFKNTNPNPSN